MNRLLILFVGLFAFAGSAVAQWTPEQKAESDRRIKFNMDQNFLLHDFQLQVMRDCGNTVGKTTFKQLPFDVAKPAKEEIGQATVSITGWTGGCVDGKRDGAGTLTFSVARDSSEFSSVANWKVDARFVRGELRGLYCILEFESVSQGRSRKLDITGCSLVTGEPVRGPQASYRKAADGRWQLWGSRGPAMPEVYLPAGALEAESEKLIAAAKAGKAPVAATVTMESRALDDLVPGARIALAPTPGAVSLEGKRVALVLSSRSLDEMERFKRERQALIDQTRSLTGDAAKARARFIEASNPNRLVTNLAKVVGRKAKQVVDAEDLSGLGQAYDYALVVEWASLTRLDLLGKFDSFPVSTWEDEQAGKAAALSGESVGGFLVGPGLKAVKQFPGKATVWGSKKDFPYQGDLRYLSQLAAYYEKQWGMGPDDTGFGFMELDFRLGR